MKQKFWKELKSRLCPRQNWVRDSDSGKCQCCGKEFTVIRRRHHCRFCGKLFCSHCSDLYINGTYLGLSEKYVRHCEFCKEEIEKIKKDLNRLTYMVQEEQDFAKSEDQEDSASSSDEDDQYFSVRVIFGSQEHDPVQRFAEELELDVRNVGKRLLQRLVDLGSIAPEYLNSKLLELVWRAVVESRMDILPQGLSSRSSYMDISRVVAVKTLLGAAGEHLELVRGMVLEKGLPVKHMLDRLIKPQVLVVEGSLDESGVRVRFQDLITNDHVICEQLEECLMRFNPDILFVEKTTSREIIDFFSERGIAVLSGLKKKDLQRIVQVANIRSTIKNVWAIEKYKPGHLIGTLDLMHIRRFERNPQPIVICQKNAGIYALLVSQRSREQQQMLKRALQTLLQILRQLNLEKYLIYVDFEMWEERESKSVPRLWRVSPLHLTNLQRIRPEDIEFYHTTMSEMRLQKQDKKLREYCRSKGRTHYLQNCGEGSHRAIAPYSQHDCTIGHFLLIQAHAMKRCSECKLHHRQRFYFGRCGIEVSANSLREGERDRQEIYDQEELSNQKMRKYLKRYKENWNIFSYFQCRACQSILSRRAKIGKNYLKNSFHYFLFLLASTEQSAPQPKRTPRNNSTTSSSTSKDCPHSAIQRVLQTSDILLKMQVFALSHFRMSLINLRQEQYQAIYRQSLRKYIAEMPGNEIQQRLSLHQLLLGIVKSYICLLQPFRFQQPVQTKIVIQLQKLQNIRDILDRLQVHIQQLWIRQRNKEVTYASDWTYLTRQLAKIDYIIKTAVEIIRLVQGSLYKRKKKIEENELMSIYSNEDLQLIAADSDAKEEHPACNRNSRDEAEEFQFKRITSRENAELLEVPEVVTQRMSSREKTEDGERREEKLSMRSLSRKISNSILTFNLVYNQPKLKHYCDQMKRRRYQLKKGQHLYFNLVSYKKALSVLACALNSVDFKEQFQRKGSEVFKFNLILSRDIPTSWELKQKIDKVKGELADDDSESRECFEVTAYLHKDFQLFRETEGISYEAYVKSLANSECWETVGGKSNSQFAKSADQILVVKTIKPDEFQEFLKFASDYLKHVRTANKNSCLAKIYGIYDVLIRGDSYKCVVMQNLFLGFSGLPFKKYDLKGSEVNRLFISKSSQNVTGLDTNFKIDKNHHPYFIDQPSHGLLFAALQEDVAFLCKNKVIDYSLLVIQHQGRLRMGIIDFMRPYHLMEKIQSKYKELTNRNQPTVIPPEQYATRFIAAIRKYIGFIT